MSHRNVVDLFHVHESPPLSRAVPLLPRHHSHIIPSSSPQVRLWSPLELRNLEDRLLGLGPGRWAELRQQVSQWGWGAGQS